MPQHIVVNITWQENYWTGVPSEEDMRRASHKYVSTGHVGHEYLNFDLTRNIQGGYKIGFFMANHQPARFSNGKAHVFFYSSGHIVGLYAYAEIGSFELEEGPDGAYLDANVRTSVENVCRFDDIRLLKLEPGRHLGGKQRIGQIGFTYINDDTAHTILEDAIERHPTESSYRLRLEELLLELDENSTERSGNIWKIAPGENAVYWDECQQKGLINIGWAEIGNYGQHSSKEELRKKIGFNNAHTVWSFYHKIRRGHIVVANQGRQKIMGIGLITGDYQFGPDTVNTNELQPSYRTVDWRITEPVNISIYLPIPTVMPVNNNQWQHIKAAYLKKDPAYAAVFDEFEGTKAMMTPNDPEIERVYKNSRNIILYGPPGTGKTYRARQFATARTAGQVSETDTPRRNYWCVMANPKEWRWSELFSEGKPGNISLGSIRRNFEMVKGGDIAFCYASTPQACFEWVSEVTKVSEDGGFTLRGIQKLSDPLPYRQFKDDVQLQNSEPVRQLMGYRLLRFEPLEALRLLEKMADKNSGLDSLLANTQEQQRLNFVQTITFHQSYGYEDFVEGLRPVVDEDGQIRYEWRSGIFQQMCDAAAADPDNDFILIIDEINRGNIAKIFGELITLLEDDKRLGQDNEMMVTLPGSQQRFGVPDNLYIIGTMNTADRSIALLDIALRRRFTFVPVNPELALLRDQTIEGIPLDRLLDRLNTRIAALLDADHRLGHSYLMKLDTLDDLHFVWYNKIIPLLQEYFYDDGERLRAVLDDFIDMQELPTGLFKNPPDSFDPELGGYAVVPLDGTQFIAALKKIAGLLEK